MRATKQQVFNQINITPLTDIFLVLLIIMMVVAPMLNTKGLKLAVPSAGPSADTKEQPKAITLSINAQGQYSIEGKTLTLEELPMRLREESPKKPDGLIIDTNPDATHNALTMAMDAAQSAGISKIAVTEAQQGQAPGAAQTEQ